MHVSSSKTIIAARRNKRSAKYSEVCTSVELEMEIEVNPGNVGIRLHRHLQTFQWPCTERECCEQLRRSLGAGGESHGVLEA